MYKNFVQWDKDVHKIMSHFGIDDSNEAGCSSLRKLSVFLLGIFMTMEKGLANTAVIANVEIVHLLNDTYCLLLCKYF
jgi:hypothetical protein